MEQAHKDRCPAYPDALAEAAMLYGERGLEAFKEFKIDLDPFETPAEMSFARMAANGN